MKVANTLDDMRLCWKVNFRIVEKYEVIMSGDAKLILTNPISLRSAFPAVGIAHFDESNAGAMISFDFISHESKQYLYKLISL
jgi:hypothetical protein